MPVTISSVQYSMASEPMKYQKLKFFGAYYSDGAPSTATDSGKRRSIQPSRPVVPLVL